MEEEVYGVEQRRLPYLTIAAAILAGCMVLLPFPYSVFAVLAGMIIAGNATSRIDREPRRLAWIFVGLGFVGLLVRFAAWPPQRSAAPTPEPIASAKPPIPSERWTYDFGVDKNVGYPRGRAMRASSTQFELASPYEGPNFAWIEIAGLRTGQNMQGDLFVHVVRGQPMCPEGDRIIVNFDADWGMFDCSQPSTVDSQTLVLGNAHTIPNDGSSAASMVVGHKTVRLGIPFFRDGVRTLSFKVDGLDPGKISN
ncbi:MAG: hypothetical protein ACTHJR_11070 [Sphingomonas sp.]|uniref:hypothetical protein n=1 Tax=Sphingomonas sp. TaxID=28214 RepID=UPI003F821100